MKRELGKQIKIAVISYGLVVAGIFGAGIILLADWTLKGKRKLFDEEDKEDSDDE